MGGQGRGSAGGQVGGRWGDRWVGDSAITESMNILVMSS